jgi:hypothetical protein
MQYVITQNQSQVLLGPIDWKFRFIQSEFDDLYENGEIPTQFAVPPVEQGYINVDQILGNGSNTGIEIFPITTSNLPNIDPMYYDLVGPTWTFANNQATMTYTSQPKAINIVQDTLMNITANERYRKENLGTSVTLSSNVIIQVPTDRVNRMVFNEMLNSIGNNTIYYKTSNNSFIPIVQQDVQNIVNTVFTYVQNQFTWEANTMNSIMTANSISQLLNIQILPPANNTPIIG